MLLIVVLQYSACARGVSFHGGCVGSAIFGGRQGCDLHAATWVLSNTQHNKHFINNEYLYEGINPALCIIKHQAPSPTKHWHHVSFQSSLSRLASIILGQTRSPRAADRTPIPCGCFIDAVNHPKAEEMRCRGCACRTLWSLQVSMVRSKSPTPILLSGATSEYILLLNASCPHPAIGLWHPWSCWEQATGFWLCQVEMFEALIHRPLFSGTIIKNGCTLCQASAGKAFCKYLLIRNLADRHHLLAVSPSRPAFGHPSYPHSHFCLFFLSRGAFRLQVLGAVPRVGWQAPFGGTLRNS